MGINPDALYKTLLSDLADEVGVDKLYLLQEFALAPEATFREAACRSLMQALLKKFQPASSVSQDQAALLKFTKINNLCRLWTLHEDRNSRQDTLLGEFRRAVYEFWNEGGYSLIDDPRQILDYGRVGPGASIGAIGGDFYSKMYSSPLTCTGRDLYFWYRRYVSNFPSWKDAEEFRSLHFGEAHVVAGNRLSFVPKNDKISRCICIEPSLNMFYQLGIGYILEKRMRTMFGIDMSTQPFKNRKLAFLGSTGWGYVTIDLSSASDSISNRMLEWALPQDFYKLLQKYRSPICELPGGSAVELNMVSTMGNGFTFPLQTMLFSCVVLAAMRMNGVNPFNPWGSFHGNWGVFGDDIIAPTAISRDVLYLIKALGFEVNEDKTFVEGPFRESCGADYFRGRDIRGVYVKRLDTVQDRIAVINQLNLFSTRTGIRLPRTVRFLVRSVPWTVVPPAENDSSGIKVPESLAVHLPLSLETRSRIYYKFEPVGRKIRIADSAIRVPRGSKPRLYNPSGLLISFLQRSINSSTIGMRDKHTRWRRRRVCTPYWDYKPTIHPLWWFNWQRWETAVYYNLFKL